LPPVRRKEGKKREATDPESITEKELWPVLPGKRKRTVASKKFLFWASEKRKRKGKREEDHIWAGSTGKGCLVSGVLPPHLKKRGKGSLTAPWRRAGWVWKVSVQPTPGGGKEDPLLLERPAWEREQA